MKHTPPVAFHRLPRSTAFADNCNEAAENTHRTKRVGLFGTLGGDKSSYVTQYILLQKPGAGLSAGLDFYLVFFKILAFRIDCYRSRAFHAPGMVSIRMLKGEVS
jgi:hypothetical protein